MAFKTSKSDRIVKASLPRKLPKNIIEEVEKGNEAAVEISFESSLLRLIYEKLLLDRLIILQALRMLV